MGCTSFSSLPSHFFGLRWHNTGIRCLLLLLGLFSACRLHIGVGWRCLVSFCASSAIFCTCHVSHFELTYLISHTFSISTKFCFGCLTLHFFREKRQHSTRNFFSSFFALNQSSQVTHCLSETREPFHWLKGHISFEPGPQGKQDGCLKSTLR